jgi:histidinol-phosphate aminotransferase
MNKFLDKIKTPVRELRAYTLSKERAAVKINQNENPYDVPQALKDESLRRLHGRALSRYPDFVPHSLHEKLARFAHWTPDGIIAGNGSNELIQALLMVTIGEGRRVLISEPTFALYRQVATILGGQVLSIPLSRALKYDVDALLHAIKRDEPDVTIICSPNNPTGCVIDDGELARLLETTSGIVAVDEAYFEFSAHTAAALLEKHKNLVIFRTFSKALGLAALRVGYLLAAPELAREIGKAVLPYNLNAVSQTIAEVAIENYEAMLAPLVKEIVAERERLFIELESIKNLRVVPSYSCAMSALTRCSPIVCVLASARPPKTINCLRLCARYFKCRNRFA